MYDVLSIKVAPKRIACISGILVKNKNGNFKNSIIAASGDMAPDMRRRSVSSWDAVVNA